MDVDLLEQITRLMRDNDLNTVDVRDGDKRVILKRGALVAPSAGFSMMAPSPQPVAHAAGAHAGGSGGGSSNASAAAVTDIEAGLIPIKSPMVGTFYASSGPEAKPFV